YGVTPQYDPEAAYWDDWCRYRRDCITELVRSIRAMIDQDVPFSPYMPPKTDWKPWGESPNADWKP
ncbi:MAG: hypothetical protein IJ941_03145, partial [Clostridia bacterium]|nr:hypothetical protein [Clostridia bacterium]